MRSVRDILREKGTVVHSISPTASVYEALKFLAEKNIGALVVLEGERIVGMFSERDYARKVVLEDKSSKQTTVREIMTSPVVTVTPDKDLEQCMELITMKRMRHLPVVDADHLIGIISIGDIVKGIIDHKEAIIEQLEGYIKGRHS